MATRGSPLEDVNITLEGRDERMTRLGRLLGRVQPIRSAADGSFAIERVAPGKYLVRAAKQGWMANDFNPVTRAVQEMVLDEYANFELLPFILVQAGIVEGRVLRKSDKSPIAGAGVELSTVLGGSLDSVVTDAEGKYRFENVPPVWAVTRVPAQARAAWLCAPRLPALRLPRATSGCAAARPAAALTCCSMTAAA
ncbi:MAG: carboxypeptidase-like regulatory domain-containing protein [Planctomycetota bacterium]|nr:carboxypeptidase-like regulatory domain-containing protein [Planctomycetota bacterium]